MARFYGIIPNELMDVFEDLEAGSEAMLGDMCQAGARVVVEAVKKNMKKSFETTETLEKGLKVTKVYRTPSDDGVNVHIGFKGYNADKEYNKNPKGLPIPLVAFAREYGTSSGEEKKPFFRKSFKKKDIEAAMNEVQSKYIKDSD